MTATAPDEGFTVPGYEILGELGRGGMGVVYRARQVALDRVVALKTISAAHFADPSLKGRFMREARAIGRLAHPHVVAAYDCGECVGRMYLAMEFVDGENAQQLLRRRGRLDEGTAWGIVRQAALGLASAAEQGLVHRDVKPANLLLVKPPAGFTLPAGLPLVKVADFGLARQIDAAEEQSMLTATNVSVGTPLYMAPEQFQGGEIGPAADIYSLGATAYCLLTGRAPFEGRNAPQIIAAQIRGEIPRCRVLRPDVSPATEALLTAMLETDVARRIGSYPDLLRRIDALPTMPTAPTVAVPEASADDDLGETQPIARATTVAPAPTAAEHTPDRPRRAWLVPLLAVAAVAMVAWGVIGTWFAARPPWPAHDYIATGRAADLFDGTDLSAWRTLRGSWSSDRDEEGALVLQGRGEVVRRLAIGAVGAESPEWYRLTCVVDRHEASAAEVVFDVPRGGGDDGDALAVRIAADAVACVRRSRDGRGIKQLTARAPADAEPRHAVEVRRHGEAWYVTVDGAPLATLPPLRPAPAAEIRFAADGGEARFSDVVVEELAVRPEPDGADR